MRISLLPAVAAAVLFLTSPVVAEPEKGPNPVPAAEASRAAPPPPAAPDPASPEGSAPAQQTAAQPPAPPPPPPKPTLFVNIDLTRQRMTITENGKTVDSWSVSSARSGYRTPTGTFTPTWMSKLWYSRQYDYSPMPHAIFFHGGTAVHGTMETGSLGRPASHGCVRLAPGNAARLYKLVQKHGKERTRIVVHGKPQHREPAVASRNTQRDRRLAGPGPYYAYPPQRGYWDSRAGYYDPYRPRAPRRPVAGYGGWFFD